MLSFYFGTKKNDKYITSAKAYTNNFLLKFSLDTLAKWDLNTYQLQRKYLLADKNFKGDIDEASQYYKHAITIQLTNAINSIAKNFTTITTQQSDLKEALRWSDYALKITSSDTTYYQNVTPFYVETNAILLYQTGNKNLAVTKMEDMFATFKNPKITAYFAPLIHKMKTNEKL